LIKLRHAAALALVGWYLLAPPLDLSSYSVQLKSPLANWQIMASFDTASACEDSRLTMSEKTRPWLNVPDHGQRDFLTASQYAMAHCVASDDPRLKGN